MRTFPIPATGYESQTITEKIICGPILILNFTPQAQAISIGTDIA